MATKEQLIGQANGLAADLDIDISTEGLNHNDLVDLVRDLNAKKTDEENVTQADQTLASGPPESGEPIEEMEEVPDFTVAKGKALTSMRGILGEGEGISADDLTGGADALEALVEAGHVDDNR